MNLINLIEFDLFKKPEPTAINSDQLKDEPEPTAINSDQLKDEDYNDLVMT